MNDENPFEIVGWALTIIIVLALAEGLILAWPYVEAWLGLSPTIEPAD